MATASPRREGSATPRWRALLWGSLALSLLVAAVYGQTRHFAFVEFDDGGYVSENPHVLAGLTAEGVRWAFTSTHMWNWHPLTWLSLMLDVQLFGADPGALHLVSVAFHLANTLLLFLLLERLTAVLWPSLIVAALFAVHPLHVESVAWIAERKDVLSAFWFLLALGEYAGYAATGSRRRYAAALVAFALGLAAKAMIVTLPFVLLLLDVWPLRRWRRLADPAGESIGDAKPLRRKASRRSKEEARRRDGEAAAALPLSALLWEKVPFFALSATIAVITYLAQQNQGAMEVSGVLPPRLRIANALVSYARYLAMAAWPADLAVFYPYDLNLPLRQVLTAAAVLAVLSLAALAALRRFPYVAVGWFFYLGTLVPVIGFVQVGSQALADRYTYLPLIGIFIVAAWGGADLVAARRLPAALAAAIAAAAIAACTAVARAQVGFWRDGVALMARATRVTTGNYIAHNNLGVALERRGRLDDAIGQYREALRLKPDYDHARVNLAQAVRGSYERAVAAHPADAEAQFQLATALRDSGAVQEAIPHYEEAIRLRPDFAQARGDFGSLLAELGRLDEATEQLRAALRSTPDDAALRFNLGSVLARAGRMQEAVQQYRSVLERTPDDPEAWGNLAMAHAALGQAEEAASAQRRAVELARAANQWPLVRTMEEWFADYQASLRDPDSQNPQELPTPPSP